MITQEAKPDTLTSCLSRAIRDYWYLLKGSLRRQIEHVLASFERIPENERRPERMVTLSDGTQVRYDRAIWDLEINLCRIAGRGYDLSPYKQRVAALRGY